jgi:hypothetical protein
MNDMKESKSLLGCYEWYMNIIVQGKALVLGVLNGVNAPGTPPWHGIYVNYQVSQYSMALDSSVVTILCLSTQKLP